MTPEQLAEARRLVDAATPGPWTTEPDRNNQQNIYGSDHEWLAILPHQCVGSIEEERERDAAFIASSRTLVPALLDEVMDLRHSLDDVSGPHCSSCGNAIDPDVCWCGDGPAATHYDDSHGFIPMGCDCFRGDRDWKRTASSLRELLWRTANEVTTLRATASLAAAELATAIGEVERLKIRQQELLATIVKVTQTTPFADEAGQVAVLIAEVGTLKASLAEAKSELTTANRAIGYALDRIQCDPDVRYFCGRGTEMFYRLCTAEAAIAGRTLAEVEADRRIDTQPVYRKREPRVVELQAELDKLRDGCDS